jgi:hypothetical protein
MGNVLAMNGQGSWLIPAISASASLLGTLVGGMTAYWTSKKSFERQLTAEQSNQRNALLREAAIRFITTITDTPVTQSGVVQAAAQWGPILGQLATAESDRDFVAIAQQIAPEIPPESRREEAIVALMRSSGALDDDVRRAVTLLTELRLVAPADVAESAQRVLYAAAAREIAAAFAPQRQRPATDSFNQEVNGFFNRVRHHMNVEDIEFDFFNERVMRGILQP